MKRAYGFGALVCALALGCVQPTAVRRTLLIPSPALPARLGAPLDPWHGRAAVELSSLLAPLPIYSQLPGAFEGAQGEPGVLVPQLHLGASFYIGLFRFWETGVRLQYTHAKWADRNFSNVIELPSSQDRGLYEITLGQRLNLLREAGPYHAFNLAVLTELGVASTAEAVYCQEQACDGSPSADPEYVVHETNSQLFWRPQLALLIGAQLHELVFVDALVGATTSLTNIGFDRIENIDDDTTEAFWLGYVGTGIDLRYEHAFATFHYYVPFEEQRYISFGARLSLQTGYAF